MGQYHITINIDKKEFIYPPTLGDGLKLHEQCGWSPGGTNDALHLLLAVSSGRGGGDFQDDSTLIGHWGGDRIAVIGDYAEEDDIPGMNAREIWEQCHESDDGSPAVFKDITPDLLPIMEREYEVIYVKREYGADRVAIHKLKGFVSSHGVGDRTMEFKFGDKYISLPASELRQQLREFVELGLALENFKPLPVSV